jgi:hypothetical protein
MRRAAVLAFVASMLLATSALATPVITPTLFGTPGTNGWYRSNVTLNWTYSDDSGHPIIATSGCDPATFTADTPTAGVTVTCTATSQIDAMTTVTRSRSVAVLIDRVAPTSVAVSPDRPPDGGAWFNHRLQAAWRAIDPGSGVGSCTSTPYSGPDGLGIALSGTCRDRAGNVSAAVPFVFDYDATPPVVSKATAAIGDEEVRVAWQVAGATTVSLIRASASAPTQQRVVYTGTGSSFVDKGLTNGRHYAYVVRATDAAGNVGTGTVKATPGSTASTERLLAPRANAKLRKPPLLRWRKVGKARYYNVQVFRKGRKILSAWPSKPHYQLRGTWRYGGHRYRLSGATYRWYLWAGYGKRSAHHYGSLLGKRSFVVR